MAKYIGGTEAEKMESAGGTAVNTAARTAFLLEENEKTGIFEIRLQEVVPAAPQERAADRAAVRFGRLLRSAGIYGAMAGLLAATILVLLHYISLTGQATMALRDVASLESQYVTLRSRNDNALEEIRENTSIDAIKYKAMTRLHMTYPGQDQVVTYVPDEDDYVRQYTAIPEQ